MSFLLSDGAIDVIPDSVAYQYPVSTFGSSTWGDDVGSADMSVNGMSASTFDNGEDSVSGDGSDDYGLADGPQNILQNKSCGVAFTFARTSTGGSYFGSDIASASGPRFWVYDPQDAGGFDVHFADDNENNISVVTDGSFNDGNIHAVVINKTGNSASDIEIYVDDMSSPVPISTNSDQSFDHNSYSNSDDCAFFANNEAGTIEKYMEMEAGIFEFNTDAYSQSERDGFVDRRPEV